MPETLQMGVSPNRGGRWLKRGLIVCVVSVLVAAAAQQVWAIVGSPEPEYRTATAAVGSVEETLDVTGAVAVGDTAEVSFQSSGRVESVAVSAGDTVSTGQTLAMLDTTDLQADVDAATARLAEAEAALEATREGQAETTGTSTGSGGAESGTSGSNQGSEVGQPSDPSTEPSGTPSGTSPSDGSTGNELRRLQDAVIQAQRAVDANLARARELLAAQQQVCNTAYDTTGALSSATLTSATVSESPSPSPSPSPSVSESPSPSPSASESPSPSPSASESPSPSPSASESPDPTADPDPGNELDTCVAALQEVQATQEQIANDQDALERSISALADFLDSAAASSGSADGGAASQDSQAGSVSAQNNSPADASAQGSSSNVAGTSTGSEMVDGATAGLSQAAQLAQNQAAVDSAQVSVLNAQRALAAAELVSPISGTVTQVGFVEGSAVDSSATIVIAGDGAATVTLNLTETQVRHVTVGTPAEIETDDAGPISGEIVSIGLLPDSSTNTSTYPVVVGVTEAAEGLTAGAQATVQFVRGASADVVTVPSSAVSRTADGATVRRLVAGEVVTTEVEVGIVGPELTEILSGIEAGDDVILAELNADVPTPENQNQFGGGVGGFGG